MKKYFVLLIAGLLLMACSESQSSKSSEKELTATEKNIQEQQAMDAHKSVVPSKVMLATVTGMTCEMGCGSTIRKQLYLQGGVSKVEYDFEDDREENQIKIYFDDATISEKQLIAAVGEINDGQYQLSNPSISPIE